MANRIGNYFGDFDERLNRATVTLGFCEAMARIHIHSGGFSQDELATIAELQIEAVKTFREADVPLPWERAHPTGRSATSRDASRPSFLVAIFVTRSSLRDPVAILARLSRCLRGRFG